MYIALLAFFSMIVQDVFEVLKDQAQIDRKGFRAGICDAVMWLMALLSIGSALAYHGEERYIIIGAVTAANVIGQWLGVLTGQWLFQYHKRVKKNKYGNKIIRKTRQ